MSLKTCTQCGLDKDESEFSKIGENRLRPNCKTCVNKVNKLYRVNNKDKIKSIKKDYYKTEAGKECLKKSHQSYRAKYPDKVRNTNREPHRVYCFNRYNNDIMYKLTVSIRNLIGLSFRKNKLGKPSKTTEILGCTIEEFRKFIESKFTDGMNWENQGKWHLDHIIPISWAKTEDEIVELNHYSNFKPMWGIDNIKKGNKNSN